MHEDGGTKVILVERSGRVFPVREKVVIPEETHEWEDRMNRKLLVQRLQDAQVNEILTKLRAPGLKARRGASVRHFGGRVVRRM